MKTNLKYQEPLVRELPRAKPRQRPRHADPLFELFQVIKKDNPAAFAELHRLFVTDKA
jgi:hypothetical protein